MIVRILTDNQYRLGDDHMPTVRRLDDELVHALEANDTPAFATSLGQLVALIQREGTVLPMEDVVPSDIFVPAPDMTLDEARTYLHQAEQQAEVPASAGEGNG